MTIENQEVVVEERIVLSKFEGDPNPENEIERIHIVNGEVVAVQQIENGEVVSTTEIQDGQTLSEQEVK